MARVFNLLGGSGSSIKPQIVVTAPTGSTVTCDGQSGTEIQVPVLNPIWRGLPSGYTQVESITASGGQYIDTGYQITKDNRNTMRWEIFGNFGNGSTSSGGWHLSGSAYPQVHCYIGLTNNNYIAFGTDGDITTSYQETDLLGNHHYVVDYKNGVVKRDDATLRTFTPSTPSTYTTAHNMFVFGWSASREFEANSTKRAVKLYSNDVLVLDLVPCKNSSNVYGMYDMVSNTFMGNSGSGSFTGGTEVPQYITGTAWQFNTTIGTHTIVASLSGQTETRTVVVDEVAVYSVTIAYIPRDGLLVEALLNGTLANTAGTSYTLSATTTAQSSTSARFVSDGKFGQVADFNKDYKIDINSRLYTNNSPMSFSGWIKFDTSPANYSSIIGQGGGGSSYNYGFALGEMTPKYPYRVGFYAQSSNSGLFDLLQDNVINVGSWIHLVGTFSGNTNTNGVKLYVNGALAQQGTASSVMTVDSTYYRDLTYIGTQYYDTAGLDGKIARVRIYNRVLSADEVMALYNE